MENHHLATSPYSLYESNIPLTNTKYPMFMMTYGGFPKIEVSITHGIPTSQDRPQEWLLAIYLVAQGPVAGAIFPLQTPLTLHHPEVSAKRGDRGNGETGKRTFLGPLEWDCWMIYIYICICICICICIYILHYISCYVCISFVCIVFLYKHNF